MEVSVIVPTYKPKEYIYECLESLKNQTLNKELFEVLLVLNGDKEPYYTDIKNWIKKNELKNFKLFYSEVAGVSNARNLALDLSQGEYIVFIDDDDYVDNNYLEELYKMNKKIGSNGIVVANYVRFEDKSRKLLSEVSYLFKNNTLLGARKYFSIVCLKIIPKNVISDIRFNTKYKNGEDSLFMVEISKNIERVEKTEKKTFYWRRVRQDSAHFKKKNKKEILKNSLFLFIDFFKIFLTAGYNKKFVFIEILALCKGTIFQLKN